MSRNLRAVFRFQVGDDVEDLKPVMRLLLRALRILRIKDPHASLRVLPDDPPPPSYDSDGD